MRPIPRLAMLQLLGGVIRFKTGYLDSVNNFFGKIEHIIYPVFLSIFLSLFY